MANDRPELDKLIQLADFLETEVEDSRFDMFHWASEGFSQYRCNTAACALGWATVIWPDELKISDDNSIYYRPDLSSKYADWDFDAGAAFFNIMRLEARDLFDPTAYPAPKAVTKAEVVKRIRDFVNKQKPQPVQ